MYRYAQLNEEGIVVGVSQLSGEVKDNNLILIEDDFNPWGKRYDKEENSWIDLPAEEPVKVEEKATVDEQLEGIKEMQMAMMMAIADLFEVGGSA